jgi:hypothetical protein
MKMDVANVGTAVLARCSAHYKRDLRFPLIAKTWKDFRQNLFSETVHRLFFISHNMSLTVPYGFVTTLNSLYRNYFWYCPWSEANIKLSLCLGIETKDQRIFKPGTRSAWCLSHFTPGTHWIGNWVGPFRIPTLCQEDKFCSSREVNPGLSTRIQSFH